MKKLHEIDKNFADNIKTTEPDMVYYSVKENDFCLYGLMHDKIFRRMPGEIARSVNEGTYLLHTNTSGGRLRFITDSPYVALSVKVPFVHQSSKMPLTSSVGFDLYEGDRFRRVFIPPTDITTGYDGIHKFLTSKKRLITINFPLYNDVEDVYIGLKENSSFEKAPDYSSGKSIVFYGSSITQGACVSRPGLAYANILSYRLGFDFVNLGFSGSSFGELEMADYIASLSHDIFVMDYDNNAPTADALKDTHERFYLHYRKQCPTTPVVMISAPSFYYDTAIDWPARREIIKQTYEKAIVSGDKNVYYIDGEELWGERWDMCTIDGLHPNDIGFMLMADRIEKTLKPLL